MCRIIKRVTEAILHFVNVSYSSPVVISVLPTNMRYLNTMEFLASRVSLMALIFASLNHTNMRKHNVNRKNYHSINTQVVSVGDDLRIIDVVANWPGSTHDAHVLRQSGVHQRFQDHLLPRTPNGILLGDSGYPLLPWLMTPFMDNPNITVSGIWRHFYINYHGVTFRFKTTCYRIITIVL